MSTGPTLSEGTEDEPSTAPYLSAPAWSFFPSFWHCGCLCMHVFLSTLYNNNTVASEVSPRLSQWSACHESQLSCPDHTKLLVKFQPWNCRRICSKIDVDPPLFTLLQSGMSMDGVITSRCDQPLVSRSHQTLGLVPAVKLPGIMFKNRCLPTTFHTITTGDADRWCQN